MGINNTKDFNRYQILLLELQESIELIKQENYTLQGLHYSIIPIGLIIRGITYLNQRNKNK